MTEQLGYMEKKAAEMAKGAELDRQALRVTAILQIMCAGPSHDFSAEMWQEVLDHMANLAKQGSKIARLANNRYKNL